MGQWISAFEAFMHVVLTTSLNPDFFSNLIKSLIDLWLAIPYNKSWFVVDKLIVLNFIRLLLPSFQFRLENKHVVFSYPSIELVVRCNQI